MMMLAKFSVLLIALLFHCGCASTKVSSSRAGATDAKREIQSGSLALERYGFAAGVSTASDAYLSSLGVEIRPVAGCVVNDQIIGHASGFNRVMRRAIKDRFGTDVFERAEQQNATERKRRGYQQAARRESKAT